MKLRHYIIIPFIIVLLSPLFVSVVKAPVIPHVYTLDIPCYAPTKITFNYAYTHNHSISDISTFGASLYKHSGGPTFYEFIAEDIDEYHFTLKLRYASPKNQTILIGLWSGTMPMQGWDFKSIFEYVELHVRLRVQKEPSYPTEEEVASQVVYQVHKDLQEYYGRLDETILTMRTSMFTVSIIAAIAAGAAIVGPIITFFALRQIRLLRSEPIEPN